ncbi:HesB/YadR/YfhF family protein [Oceanobacillus oncorhynchi subsp. oncorhynchi]|uniref:HesB/YadR/YfhF family protein n=1 Tax=Oceanobacillus TaxID=182709 RepID=UPI0030D988DF
MEITVSEQAAKWYKEELDLQNEKNIRFFPRYGGVGGRIAGFSLGIKAEAPENESASTSVEGIHFFIEESDDWYFEGADLSVSYDETQKEPKIEYPEKN